MFSLQITFYSPLIRFVSKRDEIYVKHSQVTPLRDNRIVIQLPIGWISFMYQAVVYFTYRQYLLIGLIESAILFLFLFHLLLAFAFLFFFCRFSCFVIRILSLEPDSFLPYFFVLKSGSLLALIRPWLVSTRFHRYSKHALDNFSALPVHIKWTFIQSNEFRSRREWCQMTRESYFFSVSLFPSSFSWIFPPSSRLERLLRKLNRSKGNRMFHSMNISCLFAMTGTIAEVFLSFFFYASWWVVGWSFHYGV